MAWLGWTLAPEVTGTVVLNKISLGQVPGSIPVVLFLAVLTSPALVEALILAGLCVTAGPCLADQMPWVVECL